MIFQHISILSAFLIFSLICEIGCSCKWRNQFFYEGQPGSTKAVAKPKCNGDQYGNSFYDYQADCDTYIYLDMKPCYKKNSQGILEGGYYVYRVDIKVENARSTNLFTQNLTSFDGLRVQTLGITGQLTEIPAEIFTFKHLQSLNVSHNHVTSVTPSLFATLPKLYSLDLSNNEINDINTVSLGDKNELLTWDLSYNRLRSFPVNCLENYLNLNSLDLSHNEIRSISLIDFNGDLSLKKLDLSYNQLTSIDTFSFRKLSNALETLDVSHNKITNIASNSLVTFPKLSNFLASYNQIDTLDDFSKIPKLNELKLDHNKITKITRQMFENNHDLSTIQLNDNPIDAIESGSFHNNGHPFDVILSNTRVINVKGITFNGYEKSANLDLSGSMISEIRDDTLTGVTGLYSLNLSSNVIQSISNSAFHHLIELKTLDLSNNQLKSIDFNTENLKKLTKFYAHHNSIEKISKAVFENFVDLRNLDLSFNNIKEMDSMALANMKKLTSINLSYNKDFDVMINSPLRELEKLKQIHLVDTGNTIYKNGSLRHCRGTLNSAFGKVKQVEYNAFADCQFLRYLNFSNNELESFHVNTTSIRLIKEINLANNHIKEINSDTFVGLNYLEIINLANNDIVHVDSNAFKKSNIPDLKHLYISSTVTPRKTLKFIGLKQRFETLSIGNFDLDMKFDDSRYYIKTLELKSCGIEDLASLHFSNIKKLEDLNLDSNDVSVVNNETLQDLSSLISLSFSNNNISFVGADSFINMNRLRNLDLSGNKISSISYGVLDGPEKFEHLNLSSNLIKNFDVKVLPPTSYLYLDKNPLTTVNFNDVYNSNLFKISLGYTLSCEYFVNAKNNSPENFKKFVTANPPNFDIQNIDGVPC